MPPIPPTGASRVLPGLALALLLALGLDPIFVPALLELVELVLDQNPRVVIRVHLLFFLSCHLLTCLFLWQRTAAGDLRRRILLLVALTALTTTAIVLEISTENLLHEESPITLLTTLALFLASVTAFGNFLRHSRSPGKKPILLRLLWLLLSAAFLFASLDESLRIHEFIGETLAQNVAVQKIGSVEIDDLTTLAYALGGLSFVALFLGVTCREYIGKNRVFYRIFIAAILIYGISTVLDAIDVAAIPPGSSIDFVRLANSIEECLEFFATSLFLAAFLTEALESGGGFLLARLNDFADFAWTRRPAARSLILAVAGSYLLVLTVIRITFPPAGDNYLSETGGFTAELFADYHHLLDGVDGICFHEGYLYAANEFGGRVIRIDEDGHVEILAGPEDGLVSPESVIAAGDRIYFSDDHQSSVFSWADGVITRILGPEDGLRSPEGLALDSRGNLYVADEAVSCVYRLENGVLSVYASALQGLEAPEDMAFDRFGNLYVTDDVKGTIIKITPLGQATSFAPACEEIVKPEGIHLSHDTIYVTDTEAGAVFRFNLAGEGGRLFSFTSRYKEAQGIVTDEAGRIYVSLTNDPPLPSRILRFGDSEVFAHKSSAR